MEVNEFNLAIDGLSAYHKQRKDRMGDAIGDYITDEDTSARQTYEEILSEVKSWIDYHEKFLIKANALYALLQGERTPNDHI